MKMHKTEQVMMLRDMLKSDHDISNQELMGETGLADSTIRKYRRIMGIERKLPKAPTKVLAPGIEDQIARLLKTSKLPTDEIAKHCGVSKATVLRRGRAMGVNMTERAKNIQNPAAHMDKLDQGMAGELSRYWLGVQWVRRGECGA